jgi:modification methylase
MVSESRRKTADLPLAVWPCAQTTSQYQRRGRYLTDSARHPGKMIPELARRAILAYSDPGDLVVDPMCGAGTTLVEAIHLERDALGVELEPRWAALAVANVALARDQGAAGKAGVIEGDARELPHLLARKDRPLLAQSKPAVRRLPSGSVDLILTSPPYACEVGEISKKRWGQGRNLCPPETRNYGPNRANLGYARGDDYRAAMAQIYESCAAVLKPGGFLVTVTKDLRERGGLRDLAGDTLTLCRSAGLQYWQHVVALLAAIRDGELVPYPSFFQLTQIRKAVARGERTHLVVHEDVLVFRKPETASAARSFPHRAEQRRAA